MKRAVFFIVPLSAITTDLLVWAASRPLRLHPQTIPLPRPTACGSDSPRAIEVFGDD
jgi:hypothetical protein